LSTDGLLIVFKKLEEEFQAERKLRLESDRASQQQSEHLRVEVTG
jgi:hypothetical protein